MKNTKKMTNYYYVCVFTENGPVYVTSVSNVSKIAHWNKSEAPHEFGSLSVAQDLACGLTWNMHPAVAIASQWEISTQPYFYDKFDIKFVEKEGESND